MKAQIKRVLAVLFAVLFVATLTASAVSASDATTLAVKEVRVSNAAVLKASAVYDGDGCGTNWPDWWWYIIYHMPIPDPDPEPWKDNIDTNVNNVVSNPGDIVSGVATQNIQEVM